MKLIVCLLGLSFLVVSINAIPAARLVKQTHINAESGLNSICGYIQIYDEDNYWERNGRVVCAGISVQTGSVICRDIGYNYSKVLSDRIFYRGSYISRSWVVSCNGTERNVSECGLTEQRCYNGASSLVCSSDPIDTRIQIQPFSRSFIPSLQIKMYNINASVCSDGWDSKAAAVACRQAGYMYGRTGGFVDDPDFTPRLISQVNCTGLETNLNDCQFDETDLSKCQDSHHSASVLCSNEPIGEFEVSLLPGDHSHNRGIVLLNLQGVKGRVRVHKSRRESVANWFCQRLGFLSGSFGYNSMEYGGSDVVWYSGVQSCDHLWNCTMADFNTTIQNSEGYAMVVDCRTSISLVTKDYTKYVGSILQTSSSSLLCDEGLDESSTKVACRQLGFDYSRKLNYAPFTHTEQYDLGSYHYQCTGTETKLENCRNISRNCTSQTPAFVMCSNIDPNSGYQVHTEHNYFGKAVITHQQVRGSICKEGWTDVEAGVFCRELNESSILGGFSYKLPTNPPEVKWLSGVRCRGNETKLSQCRNFNLGNVSTSCSIEYSAGVYCYQNTSEIRVAIVSGDTEATGRVEVTIDNQVGGLCGKRFNDGAALAVCRMLNYTGGRAVTQGKFGRSAGKIYDANCHGNETSLKQCELYLPASYYGCRGDAAVVCYNNVRLTSESVNYLNYGKLHVRHNGEWNFVCDRHFDSNLARRLCQTIGYTDSIYRWHSSLGEDNSTGVVSISGCHGDVGRSGSLEGCDVEMGCSSGSHVSLFCSKVKVNESDVYLSMGGGRNREAFYLHANFYQGPVCGRGWSNTEADVLCRQYRFTGGVATFARNEERSPILYGGFNCSGNETNILHCQHSTFNTGCSGTITGMNPIVAALCYNGESAPKVVMYGHIRTGIQVKIDGDNHEVCATGWNDVNAGVVCRESGFKHGVAYDTGVKFRASYRKPNPWRGVDCVGDEMTLLMCPRSHSERVSCLTAGVTCFNERSIKLKDGINTNSGSVVIDIDGYEEYTCIDSFDQQDAEVVCRHLGYLFGIRGINKSSTERIPPQQLLCTGNESTIFDCPTKTSSCVNWSYVATVICSNTSDVYNISLETYYETTTGLTESDRLTNIGESSVTIDNHSSLYPTTTESTNPPKSSSSIRESTTSSTGSTQAVVQSKVTTSNPSTHAASQSEVTTTGSQSSSSTPAASQSEVTIVASQSNPSTQAASQSEMTIVASQSNPPTQSVSQSESTSSPSPTQSQFQPSNPPISATSNSPVKSTPQTINPISSDTTQTKPISLKVSSDERPTQWTDGPIESTTGHINPAIDGEKGKSTAVVPPETSEPSDSISFTVSSVVIVCGLAISLLL